MAKIRSGLAVTFLAFTVLGALLSFSTLVMVSYVSSTLGTNADIGYLFAQLAILVVGFFALYPIRSIYWDFSWTWAVFLGATGIVSILVAFEFGVTRASSGNGQIGSIQSNDYSGYFVVMTFYGFLLFGLLATLLIEKFSGLWSEKSS